MRKDHEMGWDVGYCILVKSLHALVYSHLASVVTTNSRFAGGDFLDLITRNYTGTNVVNL